MFQNFALISTIIILAWLGLIVYYILLSNNQKQLQDELEQLQQRLDKQLGED